MKSFCLFLCASLLFVSVYAAGDSTEVQASLASVTVYRSGAEMIHTASSAMKAGVTELIIDNISNSIDSNSVRIKAPAFVTLLGFEFSSNYLVSNAVTQHMKSLEDSLQHIQDSINQIELSFTNTKDLLDVLKSNREIKGEQSGLNVAELAKLMDYYAKKSAELQNRMAQLQNKQRKEIEKAGRVNKQIDEERKKNTSTAGRLTLRLNAAIAGKADFTLSYIARNAYWIPYYDVRADNIKQPLTLLYKAKIVQTTGIDWKAVKLSLSTAAPSQNGKAPELASWFLGYVNPYAMDEANKAGLLTGSVAGIQLRGISTLNEVVVTGYGTARKKDLDDNNYTPPKPVYIVNGSITSEGAFQQINPNTIKSLTKLTANEARASYGEAAAGGATVVTLKSELSDYIAVNSKTLALNFDMDTPFDVPTNGKEQVATLQTIDATALYQHYAVPKLDNNTYLIAKLPDWEKLNLLPGEANIILEGTYVGKTVIASDNTTDTLTLTLGQDKRVAVQRKKLADFSSVKFLGSNKLQKFTYEITVRNNKSEAVTMMLKDQYPVSTNKDIEIELTESSNATVAKETGGLSWQLSLAPGEARTLRFSYTVKYPKDKTINIYE